MQYFVLFWSIAIALIPAAIILAVFHYWIIAFCAACLAIAMRLKSVRIAVRTGAWPSAPSLCSSLELLQLFRGQRPTITGSGWGFFLQRRTAKAPVLSMRNFRGRTMDGWWGGGTTIQEVVYFYKKQGLTFPSHPSQDDITIGSWFATGSHGNAGDSGQPSSSVLNIAEVVCFDPPSVEIIENYEELRSVFDRPSQNHVISRIKFHKLVPNRTVQKRAFDVNSVSGAAKWLAPGAILRVLFVGAARDGLGIRWEEPYDRTAHTDPHCCSKCCTFIQADVCSACCGWREDYSRWNGLTTLREANIWVPNILPFETFIAVVGGYINFEIVFRLDTVDATRLHTMVLALRNMHLTIGGRTEIRYGTEVVFWDMSLQSHFEQPFALLQQLGVKRVALHPGKAQPNVCQLSVVTIGDIYFNKTTSTRVIF